MVNPDAKPIAVHTPVLSIGRSKVKAGLDRDVRLGVIEPHGTFATKCISHYDIPLVPIPMHLRRLLSLHGTLLPRGCRPLHELADCRESQHRRCNEPY